MGERKSLLLAAMKKQDDLCFWCHYPILCLSEPHNLNVLTQNPWTLSALIDGERVVFGHASADHVIPQWLGGQTTERNIVAACKQCNEDRGQMHNRSWFVIDATGFESWLREQRKPKPRVVRSRPPTLFGTSLRPLIAKALDLPLEQRMEQATDIQVLPLREEYAREMGRYGRRSRKRQRLEDGIIGFSNQ